MNEYITHIIVVVVVVAVFGFKFLLLLFIPFFGRAVIVVAGFVLIFLLLFLFFRFFGACVVFASPAPTRRMRAALVTCELRGVLGEGGSGLALCVAVCEWAEFGGRVWRAGCVIMGS